MQRATVEHLGDAFREQVGRENFSLAAFDPPHGLALAGGLCVGLVGAEEGDGSGVTAELDTRERLYRLGSAGGIFIWGILRWPSGKTLGGFMGNPYERSQHVESPQCPVNEPGPGGQVKPLDVILVVSCSGLSKYQLSF